ncbi:TetR/AcrR family transcriptional regulator [Paenibacillus thailandensis]|uniref:TetR/AcrR family transcriptional regulator n=1 Tax=Paenibacillus thailandensis TaxID=393250 RepID=A0ABW5R543_9BACL
MNDQPPSTADRIKAAALSLFLDSGYNGTSLSDIAKAVGIKTPSIYAHFESKDQLFQQLFADVIMEDLAKFKAMQRKLNGAGPVAKLRGAFDYYVESDELSAGQTFLRQTFLLPPRHLRAALREKFLQYENEINGILLAFYREGVDLGYFRPDTEEQMIALFYAGSDGLLVERQIYDEELLNSRKKEVWNAILQLFATDKGKGQIE